MERSTPLLGASDIAAMYDVTTRTARSWLRAWYKRTSLGVVKKLGNKYVTTEEALQRVLPDRPMTDTARRLHSLETKTGDLARMGKVDRGDIHALRGEVKALREELRAFREKSHEWFTKNAASRDPQRKQPEATGSGNGGTG